MTPNLDEEFKLKAVQASIQFLADKGVSMDDMGPYFDFVASVSETAGKLFGSTEATFGQLKIAHELFGVFIGLGNEMTERLESKEKEAKP